MCLSLICLNWPFKWQRTRPFSFSLLAFAEVGGYGALLAKYSSATPSNFSSMDPQRYNISTHCYTPRQDAFSLLRDPTTGDMPWPGVVFGIAIVGGWYWCTDQVNIPLSIFKLLCHRNVYFCGENKLKKTACKNQPAVSAVASCSWPVRQPQLQLIYPLFPVLSFLMIQHRSNWICYTT